MLTPQSSQSKWDSMHPVFLGQFLIFFSCFCTAVLKVTSCVLYSCHFPYCKEECTVERICCGNIRCKDTAYLSSVTYCLIKSNRNLYLLQSGIRDQAMSPNQQGARGQIAHLTVKVIIRPSTQSGQLEKHLVSQR